MEHDLLSLGSMMNQGWQNAKRLTVRTRRVGGAFHDATEATVHCPPRDASIPATDCVACPDCAGSEGGADGNTYLLCSHPAAQEEALAELMRQPVFASAGDRTPLYEVMTGQVVCVLPDLDVKELAEYLCVRHIGGAPVVDEAGRPIGVVSKSDLLQSFPADAKVADVMMPMAFVLPETASLSQAAALMAYEGIHRIPVVSADGRVVGIVSSLDVARWLAQADGYLEPAPRPERR